MTETQSQRTQLRIVQLRHDIEIDVMLRKYRGVPAQSERLEPTLNVAHGVS